MTDYQIEPNGTVLGQWDLEGGGTHHGAVTADDPARYIAAGGDDDGDVDDFDLSTDTIDANITSAVVHVQATSLNSQILTVDIYNGSGWVGTKTQDGIPVSPLTWFELEWTGLNMTQTNVNDMRVKVIAPAEIPDKGASLLVWQLYVVITSSPAGAPASIEKVYGVASSAIEKKYGTNWSDIAKIYGIS